MDTLNTSQTPLARSDETEAEYHSKDSCKFTPREWTRKVKGKTKTDYILIRHCLCRLKPDKSDTASTRPIDPSDIGDGFELHSSAKCRYISKMRPEGGYYLELVCCCPK